MLKTHILAGTTAGESNVKKQRYHVIAQGNFVLLMSEGTSGEAPTAYGDLLRIEDGMIVEH